MRPSTDSMSRAQGSSSRGTANAAFAKLKQEDGPELQVHLSANLIQTLLKNDLVDEPWLKTFPVVLGAGKRLFAAAAHPLERP